MEEGNIVGCLRDMGSQTGGKERVTITGSFGTVGLLGRDTVTKYRSHLRVERSLKDS